MGGGVALVRTLKVLENTTFEGEEQAGLNIIKKAVEEPLRQIANNAGFEGSVVVKNVQGFSGNKGFNAETGEYEDMVKAGIIDPTKVTRVALENASSIAGLVLTTECVINDKPEPASAGHGHSHGAPGMDMGGMM